MTRIVVNDQVFQGWQGKKKGEFSFNILQLILNCETYQPDLVSSDKLTKLLVINNTFFYEVSFEYRFNLSKDFEQIVSP